MSVEKDAAAADDLRVKRPVIVTESGQVRGTVSALPDGTPVVAYRGIPYAEAPVGDRRYAAPQRHPGWDGVRDAAGPAPTPLRDYMVEDGRIPEPAYPGEDTLNASIFTPVDADEDAGLPVLVWIHGGGFAGGSPASPWYESGRFVRDGVIVVTVSYRLGLDGFGVLDGAPDNRAVRDWVMALEWVRDNIRSFGGDPERVTIGGQSAGASAVLTLLTMPTAQPLFRAAIAQSPAAVSGRRDVVAEATAAVARRLGIRPSRAEMLLRPERQVIGAQRELDGKVLSLRDARARIRDGGSTTWAPVRDGDLVPYRIDEGLHRGVGADKPLLIGTNANEMDRMFATAPAVIDRMPSEATLRLVGFSRAATHAYERELPEQPRAMLGAVATDAVFRLTAARVLQRRLEAARRDEREPVPAHATLAHAAPAQATARCTAPTYAYDFRLRSSLTGLAEHCMELPFVWDCLDERGVHDKNTGPNPPQEIADRMHAAWVAFIVGEAEPWPRSDAPEPPRVEPHQSPRGGWRGMIIDRHPRVDDVYGRERHLTAVFDDAT